MSVLRSFAYGTCVLVATSSALAQGWLPDYRCVIERVAMSDPTSGGGVKLANTYIGREFTVERRSGLMAGALKNSYLTAPVVIDPGSKDNSFKAVTTLPLNRSQGPGTNVYVLVVNEYVERQQKPFLFVENDQVYFGSCRHF